MIKKLLDWAWSLFLVALCAAALLMTCKADYYVVTTDADNRYVDHLQFIAFSDCRREFYRTRKIIDFTGGQGKCVCIPESEFNKLEIQ